MSLIKRIMFGMYLISFHAMFSPYESRYDKLLSASIGVALWQGMILATLLSMVRTLFRIDILPNVPRVYGTIAIAMIALDYYIYWGKSRGPEFVSWFESQEAGYKRTFLWIGYSAALLTLVLFIVSIECFTTK